MNSGANSSNPLKRVNGVVHFLNDFIFRFNEYYA
jgi:hypothetical protein